MKHQGVEPYKVCINHNPVMTLTYFTERSILIGNAFEWGKLVKGIELGGGVTCLEYANGQKIYVYGKRLSPECFCPCIRAIYMYMAIIFKHLP